MQITNLRNKLHLYGYKVGSVLLLLALSVAGIDSHAQKTRWARKNNPNYDDRKISYGFMIGLHSSAFQIKYSDRFVTPDFEDLHSIEADWSAGFSLGFIVNYRVNEFLDFRVTPKVSFYEHKLKYVYLNDIPQEQLVENTMVEFPLLAKYKSVRRGNVRMYMIGGVTPGIEASAKKEGESSTRLEVKPFNLNLEGGFGFDLYYPLFKFSPEIRFSRGILDILDNRNNIYGQPLQRVNTNTVTVYLLFQ